MSYLARLKRLDGDNHFTHTPETVPPKLTKLGCVSSVSSIQPLYVKYHGSNDDEKIRVETPSTATSHSLFHFADREPMEVAFTPAVSHATALACYPDAVAAEPQAERTQRTPTEPEAKENTALALAVFAGDSDVDRNEALAVALADPDGALLCYRTIAEERGLALPATDDDRRRCTQCLNLRGRVCSVAIPGGLVSAIRGYQPMRDVLQRCAGYLPDATDNDQQTGNERWPVLIDTKGGE